MSKYRILSSNSKTGLSLNLPTPETCDDRCPFNGSGCYAQKGRFVFPAVKDAGLRRLRLFEESPDLFFDVLEQDLAKARRKGVTHIRIFGSGDFPSIGFVTKLKFSLWMFPSMRFWISSFKWGKGIFSALPDDWWPTNTTLRRSLATSGVRSRVLEKKDIKEGQLSKVCPATLKVLSTCEECGHRCWSRKVKEVIYVKH